MQKLAHMITIFMHNFMKTYELDKSIFYSVCLNLWHLQALIPFF